MYLCASAWRERNTASKAGKDVVACVKLLDISRCLNIIPAGAMSGQPLSCLVSFHPKLEAKGSSPGTAWFFRVSLFFSFPFYTNCALPWCLHLSLVWVCAVFSRKMMVSVVGGAFGNTFGWAQEREGRNYLCEKKLSLWKLSLWFFGLIWMNEEKGGKENNSFLLIL